MLTILKGRNGRLTFLLATVIVVGVFLRISSNLVSDLAEQERERMEIWADATKQIATLTGDDLADGDNLEFLLTIIRRNKTIPVMLTDADGNILDHRNFDLPDPVNPDNPFDLTPDNARYLHERYLSLRGGTNVITIAISPDDLQYLYYEDSKLLKRLTYFPYLQLLVMLAFVAVVYFAVLSTKKAEQNKVWVGLSKETAHQLGTPISSLMAWMQLLESMGVDPEVVAEMDKDVNRLSTIASRFSKIGSRPTLQPVAVDGTVSHAAAYMSTRISRRITLTAATRTGGTQVMLSTPLFEWVMENLIKNAVDAMEGSGAISITTAADNNNVIIDVADTGKGIPANRRKAVFKPGYTTKERGWGLGLTLAKRIIEQYHGGTIAVLKSEPGAGTTFRITLPVSKKPVANPAANT